MPTMMTSILFCTLVLGVSTMLALGIASGLGRTPRAFTLGGGAVIAWLALTYTLADAGVFHDFDAAPPPLMRFMGASVVLAIVLVTSGLGPRDDRAPRPPLHVPAASGTPSDGPDDGRARSARALHCMSRKSVRIASTVTVRPVKPSAKCASAKPTR